MCRRFFVFKQYINDKTVRLTVKKMGIFFKSIECVCHLFKTHLNIDLNDTLRNRERFCSEADTVLYSGNSEFETWPTFL